MKNFEELYEYVGVRLYPCYDIDVFFEYTAEPVIVEIRVTTHPFSGSNCVAIFRSECAKSIRADLNRGHAQFCKLVRYEYDGRRRSKTTDGSYEYHQDDGRKNGCQNRPADYPSGSHKKGERGAQKECSLPIQAKQVLTREYQRPRAVQQERQPHNLRHSVLAERRRA